MNIYFLPVEPFAEGDIFDVQTDPKGQCLTENDEVKLRIFSVNKRDWFTQRAIVSIKSYLNRVELHCFLLFCIHLKLELLTQYPASNDEKIFQFIKNMYRQN